MPTVLGKRARTEFVPSSDSVRQKRRVQAVVEEPIPIHFDNHTTTDENSIEVDGVVLSASKVKTTVNITKHTFPSFESSTIRTPPTPQTPRHRDALSKKVPLTPKHRVNVLSTAFTPRTPRTSSGSLVTKRSVYNEARRVFARGGTLDPLVGRQNERGEIHTFIDDHFNAKKGGCLYISGPPGTGKSAMINEIRQNLQSEHAMKNAYVNCMSVKTAGNVYSSLASELEISDDVFACESMKEKLSYVFTEQKGESMFMVVLDEIDQLLSIDNTVLCTLFEWSLQRNSRLILVGIANALDLTDRCLPRLKAQNLKPQLLPFLPYTASEIATILTSRCRSLLPTDSAADKNFTPFIITPAIQLISKKVAAQTGDIRKAFEIAQRTIDLVESETREKFAQHATEQSSPQRTPLGENINLSSPSKSPPKDTLTSRFTSFTSETAPRATLAHVMRITSAFFSHGTTSRVASLNLQQKTILCSLLALERRNQRARASLSMPSPCTPSKRARGMGTPTKRDTAPVAPTLRAVFDAYTTLCTRDDILHALSRSEFRDVVGTLQTLSLIEGVEGKGSSFVVPATPSKKRGRGAAFGTGNADDRRVAACVTVEELQSAVEGVASGILKGVLAGEGLD